MGADCPGWRALVRYINRQKAYLLPGVLLHKLTAKKGSNIRQLKRKRLTVGHIAPKFAL
jgi:hypothetical protein